MEYNNVEPELWATYSLLRILCMVIFVFVYLHIKFNNNNNDYLKWSSAELACKKHTGNTEVVPCYLGA